MELFKTWMQYDKVRRELLLVIELNFEKIRNKYSYMRIEGLKQLLKLVHTLSEQEMSVFLQLQDQHITNVAVHVVTCILHSTNIAGEEKEVALELLAGLWLLHSASKDYSIGPLEILVSLIEEYDTPTEKNSARAQRPGELVTTLDALLSLLVDHEAYQRSFLEGQGIDACVRCMQNASLGREPRSKCVEILVYIVRYFPIGPEVRARLMAVFGEQLVGLMIRSVRLGHADTSVFPGETFLVTYDNMSIKM